MGDLALFSHPSIGAREANALLQRVCEDPNDLLVPRRTCGPSASNNLLIVFGRKSVVRHEQLGARQSFRSGLCTHKHAHTRFPPSVRPPHNSYRVSSSGWQINRSKVRCITAPYTDTHPIDSKCVRISYRRTCRLFRAPAESFG